VGLTHELGEWVARCSIDGMTPAVTAAARAAILDTIGVILAGAREPVTEMVAEAVAEDGAHPAAAQLGAALWTSAEGAALVNGVSGHALDYDDVSISVRGHPSVVVLPAALAVAQGVRASGGALLEAYVAGVEVMAKLGRAMGPAHYRAGWHATSTVGTLGSAAAAGKLLGLDAGRLAHALAIAVSEASGSRQNFGTMIKPFHTGHAARCGVHAARLAQKGVTGDPTAIEGPVGFFAMFAFGEARPAGVVDQLGAPFDLVSPGFSVKKYPCCFATHRAADAVLDLAGAHGLHPDDVEAVRVTVPAGGTQPLIHDRPQTGLQGKFSMQYVVAAALLDRRLGLDSFSDAAVRRPDAQALLRRVTVAEDPAIPDAAYPMEQGFVTVEVRTRTGRRLVGRVDHPRGSPELPLGRAELIAKFRDCAARVLDPASVDRAVTLLDAIESVRDVNTLVDALVPGRTPTAPVR